MKNTTIQRPELMGPKVSIRELGQNLKKRLLALNEHLPNDTSAFTVGQGKMCNVSGSK